MPSTPKSTEDVQVAASNQTLNAFLGGRRPSWYQNTKSTTGLKPRKSTVRPVAQSKAAEKRVRKTPVTENGDGVKDVAPDNQIASQKHDQQLATAAPRDGSLLPSPALTNELSPALSTRHASPSEQTGSESFRTEDRNTEAELRALQQSPAASHPSPATTETPQPVDVGMVHIEHGPKPRPTQATSEPASSQAGSPTAQSAAPAPVSTASPKPQTPTTPLSGPTSSVAPRTTIVRPSSTRKRSRPSSTSADNRAPQRPRTGMPHEQGAPTDLAGQWQQYCQHLDDRIGACGGWANLGSGIESPRFKYLRDALLAGDGFYVLLHQLLCLWSLDANRAYGAFPTLGRATVDHGFGFLMNILRPNSLLAYNSLIWFADFPKPVSGDGMLAIPSLAPRIGTFLTAFVLRWDRMLAQARTRKYPLTAFELGPTLNCDSRILQGTFFTVSRRVVGIGDSVAGQLNAVFCKDQEDEAHLKEIGAPADLVQKYRQERVRQYSDLAREAKQAGAFRYESFTKRVFLGTTTASADVPNCIGAANPNFWFPRSTRADASQSTHSTQRCYAYSFSSQI
ncbi:unnamed protein product [Clonostachys rhizophaga]|uniref:Uncharacterized protein n=1 Tax=Clonostachys rhizophaga TaxID=160324 RepID=A0A9N9VN58_9HYPO|nr:unnamed protein product [Clonostachys rhizophaga]